METAMTSSNEQQLHRETQNHVKCFTNLWPTTQKIAAYLQLSYLNLGCFPDLESFIRSNAVKSSDLFQESSLLLGKCAITSQNIISSLFPILRRAVEINQDNMIKDVLKKIDDWISEIVKDVEKMEDKFQQLKQDVCENCTKVDKEKNEHSQKLTEAQEKKKEIEKFREENKKDEVADLKHDEKLHELDEKKRQLMKDIEKHDMKYAAAVAPIPWFFRWLFTLSHHRSQTSNEYIKEIQNLNKLYEKESEKQKKLQEKMSKKQEQIFEMELEMIKISCKAGTDAELGHLQEVGRLLSLLQMELGKIKKFWGDVKNFIKGLGEKTDGQKLIQERFNDYKLEFLTSVETSEKIWQAFTGCCLQAKHHFDNDMDGLFEFIEMDVKSLSDTELNDAIAEVTETLKKAKLPNLKEISQ